MSLLLKGRTDIRVEQISGSNKCRGQPYVGGLAFCQVDVVLG
jgi:hypothetical protein